MDTRYLQRPGGRIAYDVTGDGRLVICAPSMGDVRGEYRFLVPSLTRLGLRVATMDLRGLGQSDATFSDHSPEAIGADMVALIDHLGAERVSIVGTSMAAASAVWAAAERPGLVQRLVLVGPFVRDVPVPWLLARAFELALAPPWGRAVWSWHYRKNLYPSAQPPDMDVYLAGLRANLQEPGRFEAFRAMAAASKSECEKRAPEVKARTLVVMGTRDPDFPDPAAEARLVAELLHGRVLLVEGAGHYPHAEVPHKVAGPIGDFLASP